MTQKQRSLAEGKSNLNMFFILTQRAQKTQKRTCYRSCPPSGTKKSCKQHSLVPINWQYADSCEPFAMQPFREIREICVRQNLA